MDPAFSNEDHGRPEETRRTMEKIRADAGVTGGVTNPSIDAADPESIGDELDVAPNEEAHRARTRYDAYVPRLKFLQDEAVHDGYELNPDSQIDFQNFVRSDPDIRKGNLVLMDNGNLRATWKDENGTRLGLQFLGGGIVQFVLFKRRKQGQLISRVSGRDSLEGLERQIVVFELNSLLCA